jgi:uridine kinase
MVALSEVADQVRSRPTPHGLRIVGVDGPSGSGKTTLAARLAALTGASVIPIDDFLSWQHLADWWPRFDAQVLHPLTTGHDAHYQARDWSDWHGDTLGEWTTVPWSPLVIIEGVTSTRAAAGNRLAYRIFVDAPPDLRLSRGLNRDGEQHRELWQDWMRREDAFFEADQTRDRADLRVDPDTTPSDDNTDRETGPTGPATPTAG